MKKTILSLLLLIFACSAFGKSANDLIRHYKKMEGAKYENATKGIKGMTQFMNESDADTFKRIKELQMHQGLKGQDLKKKRSFSGQT